MPQTSLSSALFTLAQSYRVTVREAINANELGLNALHVRCLHIIAETQHCTANDIVAKTGRDKAQIARLVKDLIKLELVSKCADENDKRCLILSFTEQGKALFSRLEVAEQQVDSRLCEGLTETQITEFVSTATTMINNIKS